jgi:hypothetical protein
VVIQGGKYLRGPPGRFSNGGRCPLLLGNRTRRLSASRAVDRVRSDVHRSRHPPRYEPTAHAAATRRLDFPPEGQAVDRSDFGCSQSFEFVHLGIDTRHDFFRPSCYRLRRRGIGQANPAVQGQERVIETAGLRSTSRSDSSSC